LNTEGQREIIKMNNSQLIQLIRKYKVDTPCIVTWRDAVDNGDEFTIKDLELKEVLYDTIGFLIGIKDDYVVVAYNKENDNKTYRGIGYIPCTLVTDIRRLSDGYDGN